MQEEVENRTLTLVVSGTKFTGRLLKAAITKYLAHRKEKKLQKQKSRDAPVIPHGKQTVKQLIGQNQGVSNIEITDPSIREFEKIARKYGVDYAVKKDRSSSPPKYLIFFKGRDADALTAAFTEYTSKKVKKAQKTERPPGTPVPHLPACRYNFSDFILTGGGAFHSLRSLQQQLHHCDEHSFLAGRSLDLPYSHRIQ